MRHEALANALGVMPWQHDLIAELYRPVNPVGQWQMRCGVTLLCPGYWSGLRLITDVTALIRGGETWMSMTPMEIESQAIGIDCASGHVVVYGLGMGWSAAASALRPEVTCVTVVERDPDVIALHDELALFGRLPDGAGTKVRIVQGDALTWRPDAPVDLLMPDIWLPLVSDGRIDEVRRMQDNVGARAIYFWGQEMEIARHAVALGHALDDVGIAATVTDLALPLAGIDTPHYADRLNAAARQWMRGRWLPGTNAPFA